MLGFFPKSGADAGLFSLGGRYRRLLGGMPRAQVMEACFGYPLTRIAIDLPGRIGTLAQRLRRDAIAIIAAHTMYPYLFRFAPAFAAQRMQTWMVTGGEARPARQGVMTSSFPLPLTLRFCPQCLRTDTDAAGLSRWRRVHQLPGVLVCPEHGSALRASSIPRDRPGAGEALVVLTRKVAHDAPPVPLPRGTGDLLHRIADRSLSLLTSEAPALGPEQLGSRLREIMVDFRWKRASSLFDASALATALTRRDLALFRGLTMHAMTDSQLATAFNRTLYREDVVKHPLWMLLTLEIAGASLDDLSMPPSSPQHRPEMHRCAAATPAPARGPCRNPACHRFSPILVASRDRVIIECRECHHSYAVNPNQPSTASLLSPAESWDRLLVNLLADPSISLREAARRLYASPTAVMRHARRLGAWRPEWKERPKVQLRQAGRPDRLLAKHRQAWLVYRSSHWPVPIKAMPKAPFNAYRYLIKHDRPWLEANHPVDRPPRPTRVDWSARDRQLAVRAKVVISGLQKSGSRTRVSGATIGRALGRHASIMKNRGRLPMLWAAIREGGER